MGAFFIGSGTNPGIGCKSETGHRPVAKHRAYVKIRKLLIPDNMFHEKSMLQKQFVRQG